MSKRAQELIEYGTEIWNIRVSRYDSLFDEICRRMYPRAVGFTGEYTPGLAVMDAVRDTTALRALHRWVAVMDAGLTPRDSHWHSLGWLSDPDLLDYQPVREWVEWVVSFLFQQRYAPQAGFSASIQNCYRYQGAIGNCCLFLDSEPGGMLYRYVSIPMREICPITDIWGNHVGGVRRFKRTARQIRAVKGWSIPSEIRHSDDSEEYTIQHMVVKREDFGRDLVGRMRMPFASTYVTVDNPHILSEGGFEDLPFIFGRLERDGAEPYGVGLGEIALPDVKELNQIVTTTTRRAMKDVDPPTLWPDASLIQGNIDLDPSGQTAGMGMTREQLPHQMAPAGNPTWGYNEGEQRRQSINDTLWNNLFQLLTGPDRMTATEVIERTRQRSDMVAPVVGQQEDDLFGPMIDREVGIAMRRGMLPPLPEELEGEPLSPIYNSPLARIAAADDATGLVRTLEAIIPLANVDPGALDAMNVQESVRVIAEGYGAPAKAMVSRAAARARQQERAQAQQQQAQVDQVQQLAQAAGQATPALQAIQGGQQ